MHEVSGVFLLLNRKTIIFEVGCYDQHIQKLCSRLGTMYAELFFDLHYKSCCCRWQQLLIQQNGSRGNLITVGLECNHLNKNKTVCCWSVLQILWIGLENRYWSIAGVLKLSPIDGRITFIFVIYGHRKSRHFCMFLFCFHTLRQWKISAILFNSWICSDHDVGSWYCVHFKYRYWMSCQPNCCKSSSQ